MQYIEHLSGINFKPLAIAHCRLGCEWNYTDVISPFSRLYLVTKGSAYIYPNNERLKLEPGFMYLIPSLTPCSYKCMETIEKFHTSFSIHLKSEISIYNLFKVRKKVIAKPQDTELFEQLIKLNPNMQLKVTDPNIYQVKPWLNESYKAMNASECLQTQSIYMMLLSRFFDNSEIQYQNISDLNFINSNLKYIHQNLQHISTVHELADRSCISPDHYSRRFKQIIGVKPIEYLNQNRIEKAQLLLLTTTKSCHEIAENCGFKSNTYFSRIFKKYVNQTPEEYRRVSQNF